MTVRTIQYTASVASDVEETILQVVGQILSIDMAIIKSESTSLSVSIHNAFSCQSYVLSAVSLTGCLRLLAKNTEMEVNPEMESWLNSIEQTILPILRHDKKEPVFTAAIEQFAQQIEEYLFQNDQTVLVGDYWSLADVVGALSLAAASPLDKVFPQQTYRWMQTVLSKLSDCCNNLPSYNISEGMASPNEKPVKKVIVKPRNETTAAVPSPKEAQAKKKEAVAVVKDPSSNGKPEVTKEPASIEKPTADDGEKNPILKLLDTHGIEYTMYEHVACKTAEELVANVPIPPNHTHTKNLFFRDKKHGLFLVTVSTNHTVDTKKLGEQLQLKGKVNLRLADAKLLDQVLHVASGCVGPLGIGIASEPVTLVLDTSLKNNTYEMIHSHPLRNDQSVQLTPVALQEYLAKCNVEPVWLEFGSAADVADAVKKPEAPKKAPKAKESKEETKTTSKKGETLLALQVKKSENFPQWYTDVITLSEMISYYDISGCYILRPWSYKMWELVQEWFNREIAALGVENSYFPMFVSQDRLEKEKDHVEGFAPEVAWVTKSGNSDLAKPIAIRPTSETIMYPAFSDWIQSHRDLPLKINQWSNVVRWEFKYPTPFLRTREFLWQEGHTAHATYDDAEDMVMKALDLYRQVYEDLMAVPVVPGYKTEKEKFAGGFRTTTIEAYIAGSGRAIQGATSHNLGQNFGKMFDIHYQDETGGTQTCWQTSWGLTTRSIGVMVMVHGDDIGLVLPPRIAPLQVVIVPIVSKKFSYEQADGFCSKLVKELQAQGIRAKYDDRTIYNPGWKYNHWEQKGVPIRIEVGPRDVENSSVRIVVRHNGEKDDYPITGLGTRLHDKLQEIHDAMLQKARAARDEHLVQITEWKDFVPNLEKNNLVLTPWVGGEHSDWEEWVKTKSRQESLVARGLEGEDEQTATSVAAKTLCIPFEQPPLPVGTKCIASDQEATCWILWGRSY